MKDLMASSDVWFCSFLISKGHKIEKYEIISRGKVKCMFSLTPEEWKQLKLEFNNSDILKFKGIIDSLKDLAY